MVDDGWKFIELHNVQRLSSNTFAPLNRVCVTTIQRLYSMLRDEPELDLELEGHSLFDLPDMAESKEVAFNPRIPMETLDFINTAECHRSIYNLWRRVLEYSTPSSSVSAPQRLFFCMENSGADGFKPARRIAVSALWPSRHRPGLEFPV